MSKTTNKFAPEVHESAVRMVIDHECDYPSRWAALVSIAERIDCGKRAGVPAEVAVKMKALEREVRKSRQAYAVYWGASDGSSCSAGGLILNQSA